MNLQEIRAKYPQYKDVDDQRLADALYKKYYPQADRREFDARIGFKPYQNMGEAIGTAIGNLPGNIAESKYGLGQMAAEAVTDIIDPQVSRGTTPPLKVTPGGPIADLVTQPAAPAYRVEGTGIGKTLPDGTLSPVNLLAMLPEDIRQAVGKTAAMTSLGQQLRRAEAQKDQKALDVAPGSLEEIGASAAASTVEMAAPAVLSVLVRNPAPLVTYFTARSAGQGYNTARDTGAPTDTARTAAGLYAAAEAVTEALAGKVFVEGGKTLVRSVLKGLGTEGATEAATEALQALIDAQVIGQDMTLDEALNRIKVAGAAGAIAGGVIAPITHATRETTGRPTQGIEVDESLPDIVEVDMPIEQRLGLPGPPTLLALPSPEAYAPAQTDRRQPPAPKREEPRPITEDERDYQARVALQRTKQQETAELLQTARETITPLGTFKLDEIGTDAAGRVRQKRIQMGRPVEAPVTVADLANARVPQGQIDALIAERRPMTTGEALTPLDIRTAAAEKNIIADDGNFAELAFRATGQRNIERMTQAQLNALRSTIDSLPAHERPVTVPVTDESPFTDDQYGKALDAVRKQGRYTAGAIKDATGLKSSKDINAIRDAMVRRGQLVERGKGDYRLYDVIGEERQATTDDVPKGAFQEHVIKRLPVNKIRVKQNGKSIGTFGSGSEARSRISQIRAAEREKGEQPSAISFEPAEEVAWGVLENRYDAEGNLLGQVVVDTHRDEAGATEAVRKLRATPDVGARYTVTPGPATQGRPDPAPVRAIAPEALEGRVDEVLAALNRQAKTRKLPLLGVTVKVEPKVLTPDGTPIEGLYFQRLMQITAQHLDASMSTAEVTEKLGQIIDHELIHALRAAGVLSPDSKGWQSIVRYAKKAKRNNTGETYFEWANRTYAGVPGYETQDAREEEAIAEAFRAWASNRRNVAGQPASVFKQIVEWFRRLVSALPEDIFRKIESGALVAEKLQPPGSTQPRAQATTKMQDAAVGIAEAQKIGDTDAARTLSREFIRAQAQAREDRYGRSGPKTVLGTNPSRAYDSGDIADRAAVKAVVDKYREQAGVQTGRLRTLLPEDVGYLSRVADAQQKAVHDPEAPAVAKAYRALVDETKAMYRALGPLEVEPWLEQGEPYASAAEMMDDIANGRLKMRLSDDMFGEGADNPGHPMYADSGFRAYDGAPLSNNDIFRVVHEVYGHGQSGFRDNPRGQYNAYHEHARLLSPEARRALATETLAQGSWANYGPHLRRRDGTVPRESDIDYLPPNKKEFAFQKAFVMDEGLIAADPGWALAEAASDAVEETPKFSKFADDLPGGRLYGNPERSPGGALSKPGTSSPAFTNERPGNAFFGGELAEHQMQMVRDGDRGATMVYLSPEDFLTLAQAPVNPEQETYDAAVEAGYKFAGLPSLVLDGYAGNVRATASDGGFAARALADRADTIPVVLYPKREAEGLGLITALEAPDGSRVPWPRSGRQENFVDRRGPRFSVGSEEFRRWFGDSKVVDEAGRPLVVYHGTRQDFNAFEPNIRKTDQLGFGIHFAEDRSFAARYSEDDTVARKGKSPRVIPVFLSLQNPLKADRLVREGEPDFDLARRIAGSKLFTTKDENGIPSAWLQNAIDVGPPARAQAAIREAGYDGVEYEARIGALAPGLRGASISGRSRSFIAFGPTQIKSAIANNGQYDAANPDIRYSLNAPLGQRVPNPPPPVMANIVQQRIDNALGRWIADLGRSKRRVAGLPSIFDLRTKLQDKMLPIKEMIEQIKDAGGNVNDVNDTYMLEQLYHGKVFEEIRQREQDLQVPLLEALKLAHDGPLKITPEQFEDYLYARHAPERNAYLRTRGAPDQNPSGMSDKEANAILDRFALDGKLPELESLARLADRITADTTRTRVAAGLISEEAAKASPYQYYVPLRGFAEEDLDPGQPTENQTRARSGKGFSVGGREDRTVTGRGRKAGDILGHLFLQNTEAVIRGQKNEVALSFMRLLQDNADAGYGQILKTAPTRRVVGGNGMIQEAGDPTYRQSPDIVTAKWKGKEIIARVTDPRLARAIKSDYVSTSNDLVNGLQRIAGTLNRYLATVNTSWNPEFLISNLARDMQTAGLLAQQYDIKGLGGKIIGNAPKAMAGIREVLRDGTENGRWAKAFRELQKAGGTTEFLGIHDLESQVRNIRRSITQTGLAATPRKALEYLGKVGKFVDDYNKVAENAFRLSAYVAAREAGVSEKQAAFLAKNLTVNFNKGGEMKGFMNALYLFYNASVQGSFVLLNGLKSKRVQKIVAGVVVAGILQDLINRAISGDEDDNGVKDYDDIPDYVLETNFVLMDPFGITGKKGYFALPMPYGFNAFYNLGRNISAGFSGSPVHNPGKSAVDSLLGFVDAFNPLGGVQSIANFVAPTFADPFVDIITNKDFAGNKIVPDRPTFGLPVPESQKYWSNTGAVPIETAAQLNRLTGGNEVRSGAVDISPELLQYGFDYVTGAMGKFAQRVAAFGTETVPNMLRGDFEEIEMGDIPFARRVVGTVTNRGNTERYYDAAKEIKTVAAEMKLAQETGDVEAARRLIQTKRVELGLSKTFEKGEKALQDLRKQLREVRESKSLPAARRAELEKQIKDQQDRLMATLNKLYFEQQKARP